MCVLTLYGDRSPSSGRSQACRLPLRTGNTSGKSTRPARLRHCVTPCPNHQRRPHAWLCNPVPLQPLEAGMMTPRRLSTVPAPLLRSVILTTGVVGLLAAFGPAGIQNTGAAPRKDIRASSEKFWKWVDALGKEFGIGRPYLGRDPPHVAPVDGQEYAAHNRGSKHAGSDVKKVKRVAIRDDPSLAKRPRAAAASKMRTS